MSKATYERSVWFEAWGFRGSESMMAEQRHVGRNNWKLTSPSASWRQKETLGLPWAFWNLKACPWWYTSFQQGMSPHPSPKFYQLGTKYLNMIPWPFLLKPPHGLLHGCGQSWYYLKVCGGGAGARERQPEEKGDPLIIGFPDRGHKPTSGLLLASISEWNKTRK